MRFVIEEAETAALKKLAAAEGASLQMVLLAVFNVLLAKRSGGDDIIVGTPTACRTHTDLEKIIGIFINTLALRNFPTADKPFIQFLREVVKHSLEAYENQDYEFEQLVTHDRLQVERDASRHILFDVMFEVKSALHAPEGGITTENSLLADREMKTNKMLFDMDWNGVDLGNQVLFSVSYGTRLFEKQTVRMIIESYLVLIKAVIENSETCIGDLEYQTSLEQEINQVEDVTFNF